VKKVRISLGLGLGLFAWAMTASALVDDTSHANIDQTMATFMQQQGVPGAAVTLYNHGKTYTYTYGVANKTTKAPVTPNTIFEVGSITKLMTTLLIAEGSARLVHYQAGENIPPQLKLAGTLPTYLSAYAQNPAFSKVTLLNLATFSASLPFSIPPDVKTDNQIFAYLNAWQPPYPVGTHYQYSNASIGLLGAVLQSQYHQPIEAVYQQMIFTPLHMQSSGLILSPAQQQRAAQGYAKTGDAASPTKNGPFPSAGDLRSTINDMSHFLAASVGAPDTNPEIHIGLQIAQTPRASLPDGMLQGMAWQIYPLDSQALKSVPKEMNLGAQSITWLPENQQQFQANALIDKTGATDGFRAYIAVIPAQQKGIVVLMNRYVSNGEIVSLGRQLLLQTKPTTSA